MKVNSDFKSKLWFSYNFSMKCYVRWLLFSRRFSNITNYNRIIKTCPFHNWNNILIFASLFVIYCIIWYCQTATTKLILLFDVRMQLFRNCNQFQSDTYNRSRLHKIYTYTVNAYISLCIWITILKSIHFSVLYPMFVFSAFLN